MIHHHHALAMALIGFVVVIALVARWRLRRRPDPTLAEDRAAPYREGLYAAIRMQATAQDLEQQIYAEAVRRAEHNAGGKP